ncbi:hypothetical protein BJ165DRAFT_114151 [Panaeolus papilionaceus]|nr:hypothetical protein BJ165DRAFT_114151 [Panaeolus papilionaceus]
MAYQFSRKGCFKCGNLGHIAESCSSEQRLCYNCRQPGHESSACPSPRTVSAKQCYSCGGVGHIQVSSFSFLELWPFRSYCAQLHQPPGRKSRFCTSSPSSRPCFELGSYPSCQVLPLRRTQPSC